MYVMYFDAHKTCRMYADILVFRFLHLFSHGDNHSLPSSKPVGLHHNGRPLRFDVRLGRFSVVENLVCCSVDLVFLADILQTSKSGSLGISLSRRTHPRYISAALIHKGVSSIAPFLSGQWKPFALVTKPSTILQLFSLGLASLQLTVL